MATKTLLVGLTTVGAIDLTFFHEILRKFPREDTLRAYASGAGAWVYGFTDDHHAECFGSEGEFTPFCDDNILREICSNPKENGFGPLPDSAPEGVLQDIHDLHAFVGLENVLPPPDEPRLRRQLGLIGQPLEPVLEPVELQNVTWDDLKSGTYDPQGILQQAYQMYTDIVRKNPSPDGKSCLDDFRVYKSEMIAEFAAVQPFLKSPEFNQSEFVNEDTFDGPPIEDILSRMRNSWDGFWEIGGQGLYSNDPDPADGILQWKYTEYGPVCGEKLLNDPSPGAYSHRIDFCHGPINMLATPPKDVFDDLRLQKRGRLPSGDAPTYEEMMTMSRALINGYVIAVWFEAAQLKQTTDWNVYDVLCESMYNPYCAASLTATPTSNPTVSPTMATDSPTVAPTQAPVFSCTGGQLLNESNSECFDVCSSTTRRRLADCIDVHGNGVECPTSAPDNPPTAAADDADVEFSSATPLQCATALAVAVFASLM